MRTRIFIKSGAIVATTLVILVSLFANSHNYTYKETAVPAPVKPSPRLQALFEKTKILCFGRYSIEVPQEAQLVWGSASFPSEVETIPGDFNKAKQAAEKKIASIKQASATADVKYSGVGPIIDSWQMRYYEDDLSKKYELYFFETYVNKGSLTFVLRDATEKGETERTVIIRQREKSNSLRLRNADEAPSEPGFCIAHGFMLSDQYDDQEIVNAGIYLPSLPDITFSVSSNKDAYADYKDAEFEKIKLDELSLLSRIKNAQNTQGALYPKRDVLREGQRDVQHWKGEESLILRPDGTHDFEWAFVGTPTDVANPSDFHAVMFTKVANNMVGAAKKASVNNDEAVALWDKLLSGLKFRVKVPGAPEGSYFLPKGPSDTAKAN